MNKENRDDNESVFILTYVHEYGHDFFAFTTLNLAVLQACAIIRAWIDDIHDEPVKQQILDHLANRRWEQAIDAWRQYQYENASEEIEITEQTLQGPEVYDAFVFRAMRPYKKVKDAEPEDDDVECD